MVRPSFIKSLNINGDDKMTLKEWAIETLWYNNFMALFRRTGRFIARLIRWIPVLWDQEEWDFCFFYNLLELKMKEVRKAITKDTWHTESCTKRSLREIDVCLARLDRYRNWTDYYYYPMEDVYSEPTEDGCYKLCYASEKNEKQRLGAIDFEDKNYKKFWKDFMKWHQNWWT